jgi:cytochrome c5
MDRALRLVKFKAGGAVSVVLMGVLFSGLVFAADGSDRSGKEVVEAVCSTCHASGKDGAPKIGNAAEWSKHATQGLAVLTQNAITGVRKMPAHGGQGSLTDLEISRAVAFMVSGGNAVDPKKAYSSPSQISGEQLVNAHCHTCHASGKEGAPRMGNMGDWAPRLKGGLDVLVNSSIRGHKSMPARAGLTNLSDADMRAAVSFMANQAAANSTSPAK